MKKHKQLVKKITCDISTNISTLCTKDFINKSTLVLPDEHNLARGTETSLRSSGTKFYELMKQIITFTNVMEIRLEKGGRCHGLASSKSFINLLT